MGAEESKQRGPVGPGAGAEVVVTNPQVEFPPAAASAAAATYTPIARARERAAPATGAVVAYRRPERLDASTFNEWCDVSRSMLLRMGDVEAMEPVAQKLGQEMTQRFRARIAAVVAAREHFAALADVDLDAAETGIIDEFEQFMAEFLRQLISRPGALAAAGGAKTKSSE